MSKRFRTGLVVGKFSPLHRGHEALIAHAFEDCADVVVLSYSRPEMPGCEAAVRDRWIAALFPRAIRLVVDDERVPANDADETTHRRFCAFLCDQKLGLRPDAVFTSEAYGEGFAAELSRSFGETVRHVLVDLERAMVPVSATKIRADVHANREWLSPVVYASFVERVCVLGGESSGKTTLCETLARRLGTVWVSEYGRDLWLTRDGALRFDDMLAIAKRQVELEDTAALVANRFVVCDTSPLTTLFYSHHLFGRADPDLERYAERHYHYVVLCDLDFAFVQDGTREPESFRLRQHAWYRRELAERGIPFLVATGTVDERMKAVLEALLP